MIKKMCSKCLGCYELKDGFHRELRTPTGFRGICKTCNSIYNSAWAKGNRRRILAQKHVYRENNRHIERGCFERWKKKNPEKHRVHIIVTNAIRDGKLIKEPCEVCGADRVHAHHEDYSKPLDVNWLCAIHHSAIQSNTQGERKC